MRKINRVATPAILRVLALLIAIAVFSAGLYLYATRQSVEEVKPTTAQVHSLSITADSQVATGQSSSITVRAYDADGNPVSGADISLSYSIPGARESWSDALSLTDQGDGSYTSSLTSQWASDYNVAAVVEGTTISASSAVTVSPGSVAEIVVSPTPLRLVHGSGVVCGLDFYLTDAYGNIVSGDNVSWSVQSTLGQAGEPQANQDGTFSINIVGDNWGTAGVTITDEVSGVSGSENIEFTPIYSDLSYFLLEGTVDIPGTEYESLSFVSSGDNQSLSLDIGIFFPPELGTLGQYDLRVEYDNSLLELVSVSDPDNTDNFDTPVWSKLDNIIQLTQSGSVAEAGASVAKLLFRPWDWVENLWETLENKASGLITWVENLWDNLMNPVEPPAGTVTVAGKVFKKLFIPIKSWIVQGSGTSESDVASDLERAENVLNKNAKACKFKYWFIFLKRYNYISENEWDTKAGADGQLTNDERDNLSKQNRWERWINVYYVPDNALGGTMGLRDRSENAIFVDDNADFDNLTLVHELIHELSKSSVKDSPKDNAAAQGGRDNGNIMNYDNTGEDISENQAELIENEMEKRIENRAAEDGGGSIYKPIPYTIAAVSNTFHVSNITTGFEHLEGYSYARGWVTVVDAESSPVAGAAVTMQVTRPDDTTATETGTTGSDGVALLEHYTTLYGAYTFDVTDVQAEGMQYDSAANVVSNASVTLA